MASFTPRPFHPRGNRPRYPLNRMLLEPQGQSRSAVSEPKHADKGADVTFPLGSVVIILLLLLTAIESSLGGSSPYTSADKTNNNKYT